MNITITLTQAEVDALEHDLLDIEEWINGAVRGKINRCRKRLIQQEQPKLLADPTVTTLPASEVELVSLIQSRPGYQKRKDR